MKTLIGTLIAGLSLISTNAFASGAQSFTLDCRSPHFSVALAYGISEADGFDFESVAFRGRQVNGNMLTNVPLNTQKAVSKIAFVSSGKMVVVALPTDMISAALSEKPTAKISVDGLTETATCH